MSFVGEKEKLPGFGKKTKLELQGKADTLGLWKLGQVKRGSRGWGWDSNACSEQKWEIRSFVFYIKQRTSKVVRKIHPSRCN